MTIRCDAAPVQACGRAAAATDPDAAPGPRRRPRRPAAPSRSRRSPTRHAPASTGRDGDPRRTRPASRRAAPTALHAPAAERSCPSSRRASRPAIPHCVEAFVAGASPVTLARFDGRAGADGQADLVTTSTTTGLRPCVDKFASQRAKYRTELDHQQERRLTIVRASGPVARRRARAPGTIVVRQHGETRTDRRRDRRCAARPADGLQPRARAELAPSPRCVPRPTWVAATATSVHSWPEADLPWRGGLTRLHGRRQGAADASTWRSCR